MPALEQRRRPSRQSLTGAGVNNSNDRALGLEFGGTNRSHEPATRHQGPGQLQRPSGNRPERWRNLAARFPDRTAGAASGPAVPEPEPRGALRRPGPGAAAGETFFNFFDLNLNARTSSPSAAC